MADDLRRDHRALPPQKRLCRTPAGNGHRRSQGTEPRRTHPHLQGTHAPLLRQIRLRQRRRFRIQPRRRKMVPDAPDPRTPHQPKLEPPSGSIFPCKRKKHRLRKQTGLPPRQAAQKTQNTPSRFLSEGVRGYPFFFERKGSPCVFLTFLPAPIHGTSPR